MFRLGGSSRAALLAATLAAGAAGGAAHAQTATTYDPAQLPATKGRVAQYSLTPRGDVDGLILEDGTQVHLPQHLGTQLVFAVKPGDAVTVRGLRAREVAMVQALQVTNDASGQSVTDTAPRLGGPGGDSDPRGPREGRGEKRGEKRDEGRGPGPREAMGQPMEAQGAVKAQLHGPRGDLNGAVLQDGTIVRLPPPEARRLAAHLAVGQNVFVRGEGTANPLGRVVSARAIGPTAQQLVQIQGPHDGPHGGPAGRPSGGPGAPPPPDGAPGPRR